MTSAGRLFDLLEDRWESVATQRRFATTLVVVFAAVLIRLALTAPRIIDAGLGVVATLFAIALTWVYNTAGSREVRGEPG